jgi:heme/copper-type cytochrome/quinol oxidase subunit 3
MTLRTAIDVSRLPTYTFGIRSMIFWGTAAFMIIEGTMFVIAVVVYFYLLQAAPQWPLGVGPPALLYGTLNTLALLASIWPNQWTKKAAEAHDLRKVRIGLVVCLAFAVLFMILRVFEFRYLNCSWDTNVYGSIVWLILGLHTFHVLTDAGDTLVLAVLMFTGPLEGKRYSDVSDNALYWYFVVFTWLPLYAVIYLAPRM